MSWVDDIFGASGSNPADAAKPYLESIPGYVDQYYNPYITTGQAAGTIAQGQYSQMAGNPTQFYNDIYSTYEPSDYYQYQSDQVNQAQQNSAASGGFSGTTNDQQQQAYTTNAMLNSDWNQYLNSVLGIQSTGLQGEQQMYNTGYQASNQAADDMIGYANAMASLAYGGQNWDNAQSNAMANTMWGLASTALGAYAGGVGK